MLVRVSLLFALLLGGGGRVLCGELRINGTDGFITFSNTVNGGISYSGTTVFLDSDIDLSGRTFEPIGNSTLNNFLGTFDGQGHIISNLDMNTTSQHVGLFGYSKGTTIKNVVVDSSCSVTSSYTSFGSPYVGGIIGYCYSSNGPCISENIISMSSVSFIGIKSGYLYLGGIVGSLKYSQYEVKIKNCANYGSVSRTGTSGTIYIGGIVGYSSGSSSSMVSIWNCLNYGSITFNGTAESDAYIGGIVGQVYYTATVNCVGAGRIVSNYSSNYIGAMIGDVYYSQISHCYWDKSIGTNAYGRVSFLSTVSDSYSFDSTTFELDESVSAWNYTGTSLLDALNTAADRYYYLYEYSHWTLNKNRNTVSFSINNRARSLVINSQIILLPSLASEGRLWFDGWYTDTSCETPLLSFEISENKELYGKWGENTNKYTITFDTRREGVSIEPITVQFGSIVSLPNFMRRDNCLIAWWENDYGDVFTGNFSTSAHNLTLHAVWSCTVIRSAADLVDFSRVINSGKNNFSVSTVFLDSDIAFTDELSEKFEPIGDDGKYFLGTFDGQGHIISNLKMKATSDDIGLFGYSQGATIKNVVMDSSCSITSSLTSSTSRVINVGSIIGSIYSDSSQCIIENTVSMASVSFNVSTGNADIHLGGIAGYLYSSKYETIVRNCANYGLITFSGNANNAYIGGVVGTTERSSSKYVSIQNCLNYGSINFNGTAESDTYIGGIIGSSYYVNIENCVSAGKVTLSSTANPFIGSIVGFVNSNTNITHSFWTSDMECDEICGSGSPMNKDSVLIGTLNTTTTGELNEYVEKKDDVWSRWVMLHLNGGNINTLGQEAPIGGLLKSLPVPVKKGYKLLFWCTDEGCGEQYNPQTTDVSGVTDLYAIWTDSNFTVTFDGNGGTPSKESIVVTYNSPYGDLPSAAKEGHLFLGWFTEDNEEVTNEMTFTIARDQTLYAHWEINNFTVIFNFNNGTVVSAVFPFNTTITYPEEIAREGFVFNGWLPNPERMPAENIAVFAQWNEETRYVEITFGKVDLSEEEVREIIEKYVPEGEVFTIEKFEEDESGGTRVIIKFTDKEKATSFITIISASIETKDVIRTVGFVDGVGSFSPTLCLPALIYFFI